MTGPGDTDGSAEAWRRDGDLADGLAGERTHLAWIRTAFAVMAAGGAAFRVQGRYPTIIRVAALGMIVLGAILWATGHTRLTAMERRVAEGRSVVSRRTIAFVAASVSVTGALAVFVGLASAPR